MLDAYVYDALRTPRGRVRKVGGALAGVPPWQLVGTLLHALDDRWNFSDHQVHVDEVILGVSTAVGEQAADVARSAVLWAGWPQDVSGSVVSRMCCSGLDAIAAAAAQVSCDMAAVVVAGGVESMSRVPMMSDRPAMADDEALGDTTGFVPIGVSADLTAHVSGIGREELDAYALRSHQRAAAAWANGHFDRAVVPVVGPDGAVLLKADEGIRAGMGADEFAAMPLLFPDADAAHRRVALRLPDVGAFQAVHTAATAPQMVDGASLVLIAGRAAERDLGAPPRARILAAATAAIPSPLLTATVPATHRALRMAGVTPADLDVVEANESFSVSPLLLQREFGFSDDALNADGGAVSMGHPLGASGGILLATALDTLERIGGRYALLVIPAALGLATAVVLERVDG